MIEFEINPYKEKLHTIKPRLARNFENIYLTVEHMGLSTSDKYYLLFELLDFYQDDVFAERRAARCL